MSTTQTTETAPNSAVQNNADNINPSSLPDDLYDKKDDYYQGTRPELLAYFPPTAKTALDVGCGEGWFGKSLIKNFDSEVWGVDISEQSIAVAKNNLHNAFVADVTTNLDQLPDNFFDVIYFNDVLEHLIDPYTLLEKISGKLSAQGRVVASIPNIRHHKVLWSLLVKRDFKYERAGVMDETHMRWFTRKSMERMFKEAGYNDVSSHPISKTKSLRPLIMKIFTLGLIGSDINYPQFVISAQKAS